MASPAAQTVGRHGIQIATSRCRGSMLCTSSISHALPSSPFLVPSGQPRLFSTSRTAFFKSYSSTQMWRNYYHQADQMSVSAFRHRPRPLPSAHAMNSRPMPPRVDSIILPSYARKATTQSAPRDIYEAVVVGAGPAGITAVGNLLENRLDRIMWVDDDFNGGRVNKAYREVPSNTKVKLFVEFATGVASFRNIVSGLPSRDMQDKSSPSDGGSVDGRPDKLVNLRKLNQEEGCELAHVADMCLMLTEGLKRTPGVVAQRGRVTDVTLNEEAAQWTVNVEGNDTSTVQTKRIIFCTGSSPVDPPLAFQPEGLQHIDLDVALSPTKLSKTLAPLGATTVAVIGASHSAVLILRNLSNLALSRKPDLKVRWFTRHPLRYAEYEDGFIALDNTGLKGEAAQWARDNLEAESLPDSPVSDCITKIAYEKGAEREIYAKHMPGCAYVVQAIGFNRNPLPSIRLSSSGGKGITPHFDHDKGVFDYVKQSTGGTIGDLARLPGVYGAGIAFPERVVDKKYGHEEMNVGFFKFMKAVKKWVPEWTAVGR